MNPLDILLRLLGPGIGPSQGLFLNRTAEHRKTHTCIRFQSGILIQDLNFRAVQNMISIDSMASVGSFHYLVN